MVNLDMYEAAWILVTKWLRNPGSGNSLRVSPPFPHTFRHASPIVFLISLGDFHVSLGVFPVSYFRSYGL